MNLPTIEVGQKWRVDTGQVFAVMGQDKTNVMLFLFAECGTVEASGVMLETRQFKRLLADYKGVLVPHC